MSQPASHPLGIVSQSFRFGAEPTAIAILGCEPGHEPPDAQLLLRRVAGLAPGLDWVPDVPLDKTPWRSLMRAVAEVWRYLLNIECGVIEASGCKEAGDARYALFVGIHDPEVARDALELAMDLIYAAWPGAHDDSRAALPDRLEKFRALCRARHPDLAARLLILAARRARLPMLMAAGSRGMQVGWGEHGLWFGPSHESAAAIGLRQAIVRSLGYPMGPSAQARHELLVVQSRVVSAVRIDAPSITGNGSLTVAQLVARINARRQADPVGRKYLQPVNIESNVRDCLAAQGLACDSVPPAGCRVVLRPDASLDTGGTASDVLYKLDPGVRAMAEAICTHLGMRACAIDYATADISRPSKDTEGRVLEIRGDPNLRAHLAARGGETELGMALLGKRAGRIPVMVVIAGEADLAAVVDGLGSRLLREGLGFTIRGRSSMGGIALDTPDSVHDRVNQVLLNRSCRAAILCLLPDEFIGQGFPVDECAALVTVALPPAASAMLENLLKAQRRAKHVARAGHAAEAARGISTFLDRLHEQHGLPARAPAPPVRTPPPLPDAVRWDKRHAIGAGPSLFAFLHNEAFMLPHFLAHYRSLGVQNFIFYDDASDDGSRELIEAQPDCSILSSPHRFNQRLADGQLFHHAMKNAAAESLGADRWVLCVDLDEFLVLPKRFDGLAPFLQTLDRRGVECVFGTMVDGYPGTLAERGYPASLSPFAGSPYFDSESGFRRLPHCHLVERVLAGVRARLVHRLKEVDPEAHSRLFEGSGYMMPFLNKVPLLKTGRGIRRLSAHVVNRQPPFGIEVALAHFKFGPDLDGKIEYALREKTYWLDSLSYRFLQAAIDALPDEDLRYPGTRTFADPDALEEAGFVRFDD